LLRGIGVATVAGLAGCGGNGGSGGDGESTDGSGTPTAEPSTGITNEFSYTFDGGDSVVGSSLNGLEMNYPSDSGALSNASVDSVTLGGTDVSGDISETEVLNDGDTLILTFGGSETIEAGEEIAVNLANVGEVEGSYDVDVTVNPQSGATVFFESF
jgi:hypothetical protein